MNKLDQMKVLAEAYEEVYNTEGPWSQKAQSIEDKFHEVRRSLQSIVEATDMAAHDAFDRLVAQVGEETATKIEGMNPSNMPRYF